MSRSLEFDVVVVGAGLAGHAAALTAADAGASVCLLEKGPEFGGSSTRAGGGLVFAGTDIQRDEGIEDTSEAFRAALMKTNKGKGVPEVVDAYVDNQLETYHWLRDFGVAMTLAPSLAPGDTRRIHLTGKGVATRRLHEVLEERGIAYYANAEAVRLVRNQDGRVTTLKVVISGTEETMTAHRGVVLTTGGFARGTDLMDKFAPQWAAAVKMSGRHNTGDGIRMAWALGADVADMAYVQASFGASIEHYPDLSEYDDEEQILMYPNTDGAIIVNLEGRRFGNEIVNYKIFSQWCAQQTASVAIQIFDQKIFDKSDSRAMTFDYEDALKRGLLKRGETVAELAEILQIDPVALQQTLDEYNGAVDAGEDAAFGRPLAPGPDVSRIDTPPFYGFPTCNGMTTTYAGLRVDGHLLVVDVFGDPIPGLYAAGEVIGGLHGAGYYSGTALGQAAILGRVAGREAAAQSAN